MILDAEIYWLCCCLGTRALTVQGLGDGCSGDRDPSASSISSCMAGGQQGMEKTWGSTPRVSQLWRALNQLSLFTNKETGLVDKMGGVVLLSGLQKGF